MRKRMNGAERVPDPVVGVERDAAVVVDLPVEGAVVFAILGDVDHAFVDAVERGVEDSFIVVGAALHPDFAQGLVPSLPSGSCDFFQVEIGDFFLQVSFRLFHAQVRYAVADRHV